MDKKAIEKEAIIADYLTGNCSYRKLGTKYGIDFRLIHSWVMKYQGTKRTYNPRVTEGKVEEAPVSNEVKQLQQ